MTEFLGRDRDQRGARDRAGYRNGHGELTVKTTAGPVVLERPKLRGTDTPFASRLLGTGVSRTGALESLVLAGFVRGQVVRDVEAALAEALGPEAALSKSTVARVCAAIKTEFDAWTARDLHGLEPESLYLDGSHCKLHPGARRAGRVRLGDHHPGRPGAGRVGRLRRRGSQPWADFLTDLAGRADGRRCFRSPTGRPGCLVRWRPPSPRRCGSAA